MLDESEGSEDGGGGERRERRRKDSGASEQPEEEVTAQCTHVFLTGQLLNNNIGNRTILLLSPFTRLVQGRLQTNSHS